MMSNIFPKNLYSLIIQINKMVKKPLLELKGFLSFLVLHELGRKPLCGDDLAEKIGRRKGGKLTPGTIYPALKELRESGLIYFEQFGRKKVYSLTDAGERELNLLYGLFSRYFYGLKSRIKRQKTRKKKSKNSSKDFKRRAKNLK